MSSIPALAGKLLSHHVQNHPHPPPRCRPRRRRQLRAFRFLHRGLSHLRARRRRTRLAARPHRAGPRSAVRHRRAQPGRRAPSRPLPVLSVLRDHLRRRGVVPRRYRRRARSHRAKRGAPAAAAPAALGAGPRVDDARAAAPRPRRRPPAARRGGPAGRAAGRAGLSVRRARAGGAGAARRARSGAARGRDPPRRAAGRLRPIGAGRRDQCLGPAATGPRRRRGRAGARRAMLRRPRTAHGPARSRRQTYGTGRAQLVGGPGGRAYRCHRQHHLRLRLGHQALRGTAVRPPPTCRRT